MIFRTITCLLTLTLLLTNTLLPASGDPPGAFSAVSNPDNPYDYIGLYHNEGLNAIMALKSFPCVDPVDRYSAYMDFVRSKYPEVSYSYEKMGRLFDDTGQFIQLSPTELVNRLSSTGRISGELAPYLRSLYEKLFEYGGDRQSPEAFASDVRDLEGDLMSRLTGEFNHPSLEDEVALILANSAIARYSYAYWYAVDEDKNNGWNIILDGGCGPRNGDVDDGIQAKGGFWKKLKKIWTDTAAFFTGDCDMDFIPEIICRFSNAGAASASCCN